MFDFHEKRKIKSWVFSTPAVLLLLALSFFLATSVYGRYVKERETAQTYAERAGELADLKAHAATLEKEVQHIESARGVEEEIRDRFDALKEGERAVIIMDEVRQATTATSPSQSPETASKKPSLLSWLFFWR